MLERLDPQALSLALIVFAVACFLAWIFRRYQVTDSTGLIVLIALPVLTYGAASGFIEKVTAPGGWAAEFRSVAAAAISPAPLVEEVEDLSLIEKAGLSGLQEQRRKVEPGKPIAITLTLGRTGYYSEPAIAQYIRAFLTFDPHLTIIFLRPDGQFAASANSNSVLAAIELEEYGARFLDALENDRIPELQELVVLTTNSVGADTTNAEALERMVQDGVDSMVKTVDGRPEGIVRRDQIVSHLMLGLAEG